MCHFVTAALPHSADLSALDALARSHGRQFKPLRSPAVEKQLGPEVNYLITTLVGCDCGTYLGSARRRDGRAPDWDARRQKLQRKGWSTAKIERALAGQRDALESDMRASEASEAKAAAAWEAFVRAVLGSGLTSELGLLLHSYSGPLDEAFEIGGREQVSSVAAAIETLPQMREDVLYLFRARA